jgi:hypothetical protein
MRFCGSLAADQDDAQSRQCTSDSPNTTRRIIRKSEGSGYSVSCPEGLMEQWWHGVGVHPRLANEVLASHPTHGQAKPVRLGITERLGDDPSYSACGGGVELG